MENSQNFPAYYTVLCARAADAIDAIDQQRYQEARALLIAGMQEAEEIILSQAEEKRKGGTEVPPLRRLVG